MKTNTLIYIVLLGIYFCFAQFARAENIKFNNEDFILKFSQMSAINKGYENEYFIENENRDSWSKMIGIYYFPDIKNPIKFAENADKEIEIKKDVILLKFVANKKQNKAILSYIDTVEVDGKTFFEHNVYKYEPSKNKGMIILRYAKRVAPSNSKEADEFGKEIKNQNDDLIEQLIISPVPIIIETDINQM